ncbi:hypothetical protein DF186_20215, partial [Enterococcus hirae]
FEQNDRFQFNAIVIDNGAPPAADQSPITIQISDVNEPPRLASPVLQVAENSAQGTLVGFVQVTDPEQSGAAYQLQLLSTADAD